MILFSGCGGGGVGSLFGRSTGDKDATKRVERTGEFPSAVVGPGSGQFEFEMKELKRFGAEIQACDENSCFFQFDLPDYIQSELNIMLTNIRSKYSETGNYGSDPQRHDTLFSFVCYHYDSETHCANLFLYWAI